MLTYDEWYDQLDLPEEEMYYAIDWLNEQYEHYCAEQHEFLRRSKYETLRTIELSA